MKAMREAYVREITEILQSDRNVARGLALEEQLQHLLPSSTTTTITADVHAEGTWTMSLVATRSLTHGFNLESRLHDSEATIVFSFSGRGRDSALVSVDGQVIRITGNSMDRVAEAEQEEADEPATAEEEEECNMEAWGSAPCSDEAPLIPGAFQPSGGSGGSTLRAAVQLVSPPPRPESPPGVASSAVLEPFASLAQQPSDPRILPTQYINWEFLNSMDPGQDITLAVYMFSGAPEDDGSFPLPIESLEYLLVESAGGRGTFEMTDSQVQCVLQSSMVGFIVIR